MKSFYHSTRAYADPVTSKQAILAGIARDGGLYVSDGVLEQPLDLTTLLANDYAATARLVLETLLPDFSAQEVAGCVRRAYTGTFDDPATTPVTPVGDDWLLELFHGPTSAFKDVALQMLPQLMGVAREGDGRDVMILTATSGDTGKAALAGFAGAEGTGVCVFYPHGGVSDVQYLQMATQEGDNVAVCAVEGNFDDTQTEVKRIFADTALAERLAEKGAVLSSANSINVGRLVPQVTYYFDAYAQLVRRGAIEMGDKVDFFVPTGNFGDVLAGYYAKRLGLPVNKLVVCSNANDVLFDFITTGTYDKRRPFHKTDSPSMDILVSSNLERLLYFASDGDAELVSALMADLADKGSYTVPEAVMDRIREDFACGRADDAETAAAIRSTWENEGVLIDPHTAVAKHVMDAWGPDGAVHVALATASPYKFSRACLSALGEDCEGLDGFGCMDRLSELTGTVPPAGLSGLREKPVRFTEVEPRDAMEAFVERECGRIFAEDGCEC